MVEKKIQSDEQMLLFAHGTAGAVKSTVIQKVKDVIDASGEKVIAICPTGIAASLIDEGTNFHRTFKVKTKDVSLEMIREVFTLDVELTVVNEVPIVPSKCTVMMD